MNTGLIPLRTEDECIQAEKYLKYLVKEHKWIKDSKAPREEIKSELKELLSELKTLVEQYQLLKEKRELLTEDTKSKGESETELNEEMKQLKIKQRELLKRIHDLIIKDQLIAKGEYQAELIENIKENLVLVEQFRATQEKHSLADIIKGFFTHPRKTMHYLQRKNMVSWANRNRVAQRARCLSLETPNEVMDYMRQTYKFEGITLPEKEEVVEETALVLAEDFRTPAYERMQRMVMGHIQYALTRKDRTASEARQQEQNHEGIEHSNEEKSVTRAKKTIEPDRKSGEKGKDI